MSIASARTVLSSFAHWMSATKDRILILGLAMSDNSLVSRFLAAIQWAANRRLRIIVNDEDVKLTIYFNSHVRVTPIQVMTAVINAIDNAKKDPRNSTAEELKEAAAVPDELDEMIK